MMGRNLWKTFDEVGGGSWVPAVDIKETEDAFLITADLPGFSVDDVEVTVENRVLTIRGERAFEEASEGESYRRVERSYGTFTRSFNLPESVESDKVEAMFRDGVMSISLPRREESKPRSIKVKVEKN
jgi:HSP20 family protein